MLPANNDENQDGELKFAAARLSVRHVGAGDYANH